MKKLTVADAESLACKFRADNSLALNGPVDTKTLLRSLNITAMYRSLSETSFGISCRSKNGKMFMLINSNSTIGRQHFTIAHELYHLFYDENPVPHICFGAFTGEEKNANMFASALLLPREGIFQMVRPEEISNHSIGLATILKMEQLFQVSRINLLLRLKELNLITEAGLKSIQAIPVKESAREYGYDISLYEPGNCGLFIGDFGEKARILYESEKISEGHYQELLNMISDGGKEN